MFDGISVISSGILGFVASIEMTRQCSAIFWAKLMERSKMARVRSSAPGWPLAPTAPMFQQTDCPASRLAVWIEEQPTLGEFLRNPREHIVVHIVGNGYEERSTKSARASSVSVAVGAKRFLSAPPNRRWAPTGGIHTWLFHCKDAVVHQPDYSRGARVVEETMGGHEPEVWISDRYSAQQKHGAAHQTCLAHLARDTAFALEHGSDDLPLRFKLWFGKAFDLANSGHRQLRRIDHRQQKARARKATRGPARGGDRM